MAIVTFISDFGDSDHYVGAVKASVLKENPAINIIDISHSIKVGDVGHAAYVLEAVFRDFPIGTVHLIGISNANLKKAKLVAVKLEDHYFVGEDAGIISLLSEKSPSAIVDVNSVKTIESTFPMKDVLGAVAGKLASGKEIQDLGMRLDELERFVPSRSKPTKEQIAGNVIRIDNYGNLITNILKSDFDAILKINKECPYEINFRREKVTRIHAHFSEVTAGECFVIFNAEGRLVVGILQGHGGDLLGLGVNDQVFVDFKI
ncbi:MAG: SAM-dependent chlorinase/fluorinase [Reichenbachiella sp.]